MGDVDLVKVVLDEIAEMRWMQVAIRPAKPFAFGVLDGVPVFGLPGNPVSSMVSLALLGVPGLRRLAGRSDLDLPRVPATLAAPVRGGHDGRTAYLRAVCRWDATTGALVAQAGGAQGSHHLAAAADANALLEVPSGAELAAGASVTAVLLGAPRP
jgi:molybdopterin biosynthesis enzyme